ncbi:MAG: glycosyltransferase family 2 protein [Candidatus Yanofskybacteria bacterium]|nr:glycosyltransferase family 2 protein [Candidatus Yanofskybacteria bacterium]
MDSDADPIRNPDTMMLSVIIVNFKNAPLLRLALTSLARTLSRQIPYEVIVVDSATSAETQNVVHHDCAHLFDRIVLVPFAENIGYTRGVNEGLRRATGTYLLNLNPDIVILPGTVEAMMQYLADHPQTGLIGPGLLNFDDTRQDSCFRFYTPLVMVARRIPLPFTRKLVDRFLMRDQDCSAPLAVDWIMGSALMTTRAAYERVGAMDERFFLYLSEVDWAWRFWENGYTVAYLPSVRMYHYHQRQSKGRFGVLDVIVRPQTRWHIRDAFRYFRKHGTHGRRPQVTPAVQAPLITS